MLRISALALLTGAVALGFVIAAPLVGSSGSGYWSHSALADPTKKIRIKPDSTGPTNPNAKAAQGGGDRTPQARGGGDPLKGLNVGTIPKTK